MLHRHMQALPGSCRRGKQGENQGVGRQQAWRKGGDGARTLLVAAASETPLVAAGQGLTE